MTQSNKCNGKTHSTRRPIETLNYGDCFTTDGSKRVYRVLKQNPFGKEAECVDMETDELIAVDYGINVLVL